MNKYYRDANLWDDVHFKAVVISQKQVTTLYIY
jgi:hypothetical protein